jgi:hypothetical protein
MVGHSTMIPDADTRHAVFGAPENRWAAPGAPRAVPADVPPDW